MAISKAMAWGFGKSGGMSTDDLIDIVLRNAHSPGIRVWASRWGRHFGAPPGTITMTVGSIFDGHAYNLPRGWMPHKTLYGSDEKVAARGWADVLTWLVMRKVIRPSREIRELMGDRYFEKATQGLGCW